MKLVRTACAVLLLVASMLAPAYCGSTGQIVGTVQNSEKHPIAGAAVDITSPSGSYRAVSDAKGTFAVTGVSPDTYVVSVQATGFEPASIAGVTVFTDEIVPVHLLLSKHLRTIARTVARSSTSAFQPHQTVDRYTLNAGGIEQFLGKSFNTDEMRLLRSLPSVTVDKSGAPLIRGGYSYQTAFEFEGIDYTEPNASLLNRFQNTGNANLLNGVGTVEIIPGGGDATHGNTGTGLVVFTAKRGTAPSTGVFDAEMGSFGARQLGVEYGTAGSNVSNYFSYISEYQPYQYGSNGIDPRSIGASPLTANPNANSNVNAHYGTPYTTAFFNPASLTSRDFIENLVYKFGKNHHESLQFFLQTLSASEVLDYGGVAGLDSPDPATYLFDPLEYDARFFSDSKSELAFGRSIVKQFPGGVPAQPLTGGGTAQNPFDAYKLEYQDILNANTSVSGRIYHTYSSQSLIDPVEGLYYTSNGGERNGASIDFNRYLSDKNSLHAGGKFEFASPFGTREDYIDYASAYTGGANKVNGVYQINLLGGANVLPDFVTPQNYYVGRDADGNVVQSGTPGCINARPLSGSSVSLDGNGVPCGYLMRFFPSGNLPQLPPEVEIPTAHQQSYGLFLQDTYSPNTRLSGLFGVRLDGFNFLIPDDPTNPPALDGLRQEHQYEPHIGVSYQLTRTDTVRFNFGRTLAIPLASFLGDTIDRNAFNAFNAIPSYDNARGVFDPSRPTATQAMYCGVGKPVVTSVTGFEMVEGTQPCASYGDQLYWLIRNYRYGLQEQLNFPLRAATFTNYDFSYSHEFHDGTAFKITPFYRRGYNIAETTRTLLGYDPLVEIPILSPSQVSNLGEQRATGVEFFLTKPSTRKDDIGLSYQLSATYINQFGNDPPGWYLPTASLQLGLQYHSPNIAPLQSTIGLTYKSKSGWKFNPTLTVRSGYPYGDGVYQAFTFDGKPIYAPLTDAIIGGTNDAVIAPALVDPQNPGTVTQPNIIASRGTEPLTSGPGELRSHASALAGLGITYTPPGTAITWGLALDNIFDQLADIPVTNLAQIRVPVGNGRYYTVPGTLGAGGPAYTTPVAIGSTTQPYIVFPNQTPFSAQFYVQVKL